MNENGYDSGQTKVTAPEKISDASRGSGNDCLVLIYPAGVHLGVKFGLDRPVITIGRDSENNIVLDKDSVSRRHAKLVQQNSARVVVDLNSTNGTYVNDQTIKSHALKNGDRLKIGDTIFKYLTGHDVESSYHEEIYRMTIIDGLTGIFNKRYFTESLDREVARARRYRRELSLLMFDLDHFKNVNDTYGHLAGDHVLKDLARLIQTRSRREETFARYGGEEFIMLLPETAIEGAAELAEQLRAKVEQHQFVFEGEIIPITISVGVAALGSEHTDVTTFLKSVDEKLYEAKNDGRNRVAR